METCSAVMPCSSVALWNFPALRRRGRVRLRREDIFARHVVRSRSWNTSAATNWISRWEASTASACMSRATSFGAAIKSRGCQAECAPNITRTDHDACSVKAGEVRWRGCYGRLPVPNAVCLLDLDVALTRQEVPSRYQLP